MAEGWDIFRMSVYPGAVFRPLGKQTQPKMGSHDIICLHTMVGYLTTTDTMFRQHGYAGLESHFGVGGNWGPDQGKLDGTVYQWQDTVYTADANLDGNHRIISIETADNAPAVASEIKPWTEAQLSSIVNLVAWLCRTHNIPATMIPDSKPGRRGIAYHRLGIDPWRVKGGELWSSSRGKECPGDARIAQLHSVVIPLVQQKLNPTPKVDDDVPLTDADAKTVFNTQYRDFLDTDGDPNTPRALVTMAQAVLFAREDAFKATQELAELKGQVATLATALTNLQASVDALAAKFTPPASS